MPRKAAVRRHTPHPPPATVPPADEALLAAYRDAARAAARFGKAVTRFLDQRPREQVQAWMQACVAGARPALEPWCLEILFSLAVGGEARFSELARRLEGISSRTLTDKLASLQGAGLVEKRVALDGSRVRISYRLTPRGLGAASNVGPFMGLMMEGSVFDARDSAGGPQRRA